MNIPEITIETKQGPRSESAAPAKAVDRPPVQESDDRPRIDAVNAQDETQEKQTENRSREELASMIAEAEEHLEANNVKLKFNIIEEDDTVQVEVIDSDGKTIRKIPDDDLVKLTKSLKNLGQGFLDEVS